MHAVKVRFTAGLHSFDSVLEQCVRAVFHWVKEIILEELCKEIGAQAKAEID